MAENLSRYIAKTSVIVGRVVIRSPANNWRKSRLCSLCNTSASSGLFKFQPRILKKYTRNKSLTVLGIESSCDDTGAAVVNQDGSILGEGLHSQTKIHVEAGGIIPPVARDLHKEHIENVVNTALSGADMSIQDVDAIATTVKPGLIMSLDIGMTYARKLVNDSRKPFIPIHHMEAHALTARMTDNIPFPFLVLLMSGGHCLLAVVRDIENFLLLGTTLDIAPGDAIDKVARALRLNKIPQCSNMSGGQSIEHMARNGDPNSFHLYPKMNRHRNCNFSFSGARTGYERMIKDEEEKFGVHDVDILPNVADVCASFQLYLLKIIANRVQRAIIYCNQRGLLEGDKKTLVLSGGVASNGFLRSGIRRVCNVHDVHLVCPPPRLCTDNGVMIAWNGMEKLKLGRGFADIDKVDIQAKCPLGTNISNDVAKANIKVERIKIVL